MEAEKQATIRDVIDQIRYESSLFFGLSSKANEILGMVSGESHEYYLKDTQGVLPPQPTSMLSEVNLLVSELNHNRLILEDVLKKIHNQLILT